MKLSHTSLYQAAEALYEAKIAEAKAVLEIYFTNPVGIGEHSDLLTEVDKWVSQLAEAEEKLETLQDNFS